MSAPHRAVRARRRWLTLYAVRIPAPNVRWTAVDPRRGSMLPCVGMLAKLPAYLIAVLFVTAGTLHLVRPKFFLRMMPPYVPFHRLVVFASGVAEIVLGTAMLSDRLRAYAGYGLVVLLFAVFPANVHMYQHPELFPRVPRWSLAFRLPLQALLVLWVYWTAIAR